MKQPWLDEKFSDVIDTLKQKMFELKQYLSDSEIGSETVNQLSDIILNLDELFLLVIVGEVKSGKSSFINALLAGCKARMTKKKISRSPACICAHVGIGFRHVRPRSSGRAADRLRKITPKAR